MDKATPKIRTRGRTFTPRRSLRDKRPAATSPRRRPAAPRARLRHPWQATITLPRGHATSRSIHFICRDREGLRCIGHPVYESGNWGVTKDEAESLIGGTIYL